MSVDTTTQSRSIAASAWDEGYAAAVAFKLAFDTERLRAKNDKREPDFPQRPVNPWREDES